MALDVDNQIALDPHTSTIAVSVAPGPPPGIPALTAFFKNLRLLSRARLRAVDSGSPDAVREPSLPQ